MTTPVGGEAHAGAPRSGTGAAFMVDDTSLRHLKKTFGEITTEINSLRTALRNLNGADLDTIANKLGGVLGGGVPSGAPRAANVSHGGLSTPNISTPVGGAHIPLSPGRIPPGNQGAVILSAGAMSGGKGSAQPALSASTINGQPAGGGGSNAPYDPHAGGYWDQAQQFFGRHRGYTLAAGMASAAVGSAGSFVRNRMGGITGADLFFNQQAQAMGGPGGYNAQNKTDTRNFLFGTGARGGGLTGYSSSQDLISGVSGLLGTTGGTVMSPGNQRLIASMGQLANLNPAGGLAGATQAAVGLYTPQTTYRLMSMGVTAGIGPGGVKRTPQEVYSSLLRRTYGGRMPTARELAEGGQQGSSLWSTARAAGVDLTQLQQYGTLSANLGGNQKLISEALADPHSSAAKKAGLGDSIIASMNTAGRAAARQEQAVGGSISGILQRGFEDVGDIRDTIRHIAATMNVGGVLGGSAALGQAVGNPLKMVGGATGAFFGGQALKSVLGRFGTGRAGKIGAAARLGSKVGTAVSALDATPVFVVNWPSGGLGGGGGDVTDLLGGASKEGRLAKLGKMARAGKYLFGAEAATLGLAAAAGTALGLGASAEIHGFGLTIPGFGHAASDSEVKNIDARGDMSAKVGAMEVKLRSAHIIGHGAVGQAEWLSSVEPLVRRAVRTHNDRDFRAALHAMAQLLHKYNAVARQGQYASHFDVISSKGGYGSGDSSGVSQTASRTSAAMGGGTGGTSRTMPANGPITQHFGAHNKHDGPKGHPGVDFGAPKGSPIVAAADGTVSFAGSDHNGFGHAIVIDHDGVSTLYGHMYGPDVLAHVGQKVKAGQQIGRVGSDGYSTGPHLHFEVHGGHDLWSVQGHNMNPEAWLRGAGPMTAAGSPPGDASGKNGPPNTSFSWAPGATGQTNPSIEEVAALAAALSGSPGGAVATSYGRATRATSDQASSSSNGAPGRVPAGGSAGVNAAIARAAKQMGVPFNVAKALAALESGLNPKSVGDHGTSFGLYQLHRGGELGSHTKEWAFDPYNNAMTSLSVVAATRRRMPNADWGSVVAAAQRPADPRGYAAKFNASMGSGDSSGVFAQAARTRGVISGSEMHSGGGMSMVPGGGGITIYAPVTLAGQATDEDARRWWGTVKRVADADARLTHIGKG